MKVLVADDSRLHRQIMVDALETQGYEAIVAQDGIEAARLALAEPVDLIVLDIEMPGMNGYQVAHILKDDPGTSPIPLIFLTSRSGPGDAYWGRMLGAVHYLAKNAPREEIMAAIREALAAAPPREERSPHEPASPEQLLGRLANILDRRLFESKVISELAALAHESHDYRATLRTALLTLQRMADFDVAVMILPLLEETIEVVGHRVDRKLLADAEKLAVDTLPGDCFVDAADFHRSIGRRNLLGGASGETFASWAALLEGGEGALGAVAVVATERRALTEASERALERALPTLAMVVDNLRLYEHMRLQATTDGLTGAFNHRYFQELLSAECKRAQRARVPVGLLMADLDHFKQVNDMHGHLCGDRVLADVAQRISTQLRQSDRLARYGGEEFAILLPDTDIAGAVKVAERVRGAVSVDPVRLGKADGALTISVGAASAEGGDLAEPSDLVDRADQALYEAKRLGRNTVVAYRPVAKAAKKQVSAEKKARGGKKAGRGEEGPPGPARSRTVDGT